MNNIVNISNGQPVTTTLAIAEGTGNNHEAVIKLVRRYHADLEQFGTFGFQIQKSGGRPIEYALLNEHQSTLLMTYMRNSEIVREFKIRLVKAFYELAQNRHRDPVELLGDPAAMRGLLLNYSEKVIDLEEQVSELTPKVEAWDRLATADGSMCITDAAKHLQMRPKDLFLWLQANGWIYRRQGGSGWLAYQRRIQQGLMEHKIDHIERSDGTEKVREQARVTSKGLQRLSLEIRSQGKAA